MSRRSTPPGHSSFAERHARETARRLVLSMGIDRPEHIRIEDIAWAQGLRIVEGGLSGAAARLTLREGRGVIRLREGDGQTPRGRFSVGHEVGHFLLHQGKMGSCSDEDMENFHSDGSVEAQANVFSAELLAPEFICRPFCARGEPSFEMARDIGRVFSISLTAASLRLIELSPEPCALIFVENQRIKWFRAGDSFKVWLNVAGPPHKASLVARMLRGAHVDGPEVVDPSCWLDDDRPLGDAELVEDVVHMTRLKAALVLLHLDGWEDPED